LSLKELLQLVPASFRGPGRERLVPAGLFFLLASTPAAVIRRWSRNAAAAEIWMATRCNFTQASAIHVSPGVEPIVSCSINLRNQNS
jgi:hypothetical protein